MIRSLLIILLPSIFLAGLVLYFKPQLQSWFETTKLVKPAVLQVGTIHGLTGGVEVRARNSSSWKPAQAGPINHLDQLQTGKKSKVTIELFDSGYEIEIQDRSTVTVEKWNAIENKGPYYILLTRGDLRVVNSGKPGELYILENGQLSLPEKRSPQPSESIAIAGKSKWPVNSGQPDGSSPPAQTKTTKPQTDTPTSSSGLSTQLIESIIAKKKSDFQRCQTISLRDGLEAKGTLLIGFVIKSTGKTNDIRLLQSSFKEGHLPTCIKKVFARVKFKAFDGEPIYFSYPMAFE